MAADNKGSDLDIFEGLAKKGPVAGASAPPPPPRPVTVPPARPSDLMKRTLVGVAQPPLPLPPAAPPVFAAPPSAPNSGPPTPQQPILAAPAMAALRTPLPVSAPPPPPGRSSLPPVMPPPVKAASAIPPPVVAAPPAPQSSSPTLTAPASSSGNGAISMDWDDEDETTSIFDKGGAEDISIHSKPIPAAGTPLVPPVKTLPGLPVNGFPTSPGLRRNSSVPPPPPAYFPDAPGSPSQPLAFPHAARTFESGPLPNSGRTFAPAGSMPPPQLGMPPQVSTAPLPMPGSRTMPPMNAAAASSNPFLQQNLATPPPSRLEATQLVRSASSGRLGVLGLGALFAALAAGMVVFLVLPRTGRIDVNVSDAKSNASLDHVEIFVDGKKQCDTAPCVVDQVSSGDHVVKVLASGYEQPTERTLTVESRKNVTADFSLTPSAATASSSTHGGGTGLRVSGNQTGVKLFIDGKEVGPLPQEVKDLAPGDHKIRLAGGDRYAPLEKSVTVVKDDVMDLGSPTLKVTKGKATITLGTAGARVSIVSGGDRREFPSLPIAVDLDTSKAWALEASKPGYSDYHQLVSFDDGQAEKTFNVTLDPKAAVGGYSPPVAYNNPPPVTHSAPATPRPAAPKPEGDGPVAAAATGDSFLNINSIPASSVLLDGKMIGSTPKVHVQVSPGSHTVVFTNAEQGLKKEISVSVAAGETKPAIAKLRD